MRGLLGFRCAVLLALVTSAGSVHAAQDLWTGFDAASYELVEDATGYRLTGGGREPIAVPREWLEPEAARKQDEEAYVSSLEWGRGVTAFALGDGRVGLHLSSYAIATEGSAQAAAGRDLFLIHNPATNRLGPGLDLGETKGRVRVGGCFAAWYHRLQLGDVDCDGRLDLGVVEERIDCPGDGDDAETRLLGPFRRTGELQWFVLGEEAWRESPTLAGRLPCFGMREFPPLGVAQNPVDWVLGMTKLRAAVLPPRGDSATPAIPARPAGAKAVDFARAGIRLHLPPTWEVERADSPWAQVTAPEAGIDVRVDAIPAGRTLDQEIAERLQHERRMSETVKVWSFHSLIEEASWTAASGLRGRRAMFGVAAAPRRLVYYFANHRGELVTIDTRFHVFESGGFWDRYDRLLRDGLELLPAASPADTGSRES